MIMRFTRAIAPIGAALVLGLAGAGAGAADSISDVENARAKDRAGYHTSRQDREKLRRYGRNDDHYGYRDYGGYSDGAYYDGPGVSVYVGPRHYHDSYGY
jgi:hypothetical protein